MASAASRPARHTPHWERERNARLFNAIMGLAIGSVLLFAAAKLII